MCECACVYVYALDWRRGWGSEGRREDKQDVGLDFHKNKLQITTQCIYTVATNHSALCLRRPSSRWERCRNVFVATPQFYPVYCTHSIALSAGLASIF